MPYKFKGSKTACIEFALNNLLKTEDSNKTSGSSTKQNTKGQGQGSSELEKSQEQLEGIEGAQDHVKKQKKGNKQNKIQSVEKSKQRNKHQLNRIDDLDND